MWNNYYQLGEKVLTERLHKEIFKLFKIKPPNPLKYKVYYWRGGVHMWRTRNPMDETYKKLLKPFETHIKHQLKNLWHKLNSIPDLINISILNNIFNIFQ